MSYAEVIDSTWRARDRVASIIPCCFSKEIWLISTLWIVTGGSRLAGGTPTSFPPSCFILINKGHFFPSHHSISQSALHRYSLGSSLSVSRHCGGGIIRELLNEVAVQLVGYSLNSRGELAQALRRCSSLLECREENESFITIFCLWGGVELNCNRGV